MTYAKLFLLIAVLYDVGGKPKQRDISVILGTLAAIVMGL
jgi:hypothetical protein